MEYGFKEGGGVGGGCWDSEFSLWKAKEFGLHAAGKEMSTLGAQRNKSNLKFNSGVRSTTKALDREWLPV